MGNENVAQILKPLDYGFTEWRVSSQRSADLYRSGVKLWTKEDLRNIEQQLSQSYSIERFSVRRIDGSIIQISNPMFRVRNPIWKPHVKFQDYWQLVQAQPNGPTETYLCSYIVDWTNRTKQDFRALLAQPLHIMCPAYQDKDTMWRNSKSYKDIISLVRGLVGETNVKKVLCFGLGDFCRSTPEWVKSQHGSWDAALDIEHMAGCMIQHCMALTIAGAFDNALLPLLTQDPEYTEMTQHILSNEGFKIIGPYGAGGFAEIDCESIVISPFPNAPVKQVIADLARPVMIISTSFDVFNIHEKPLADAESPRTMEMWGDYDVHTLPTHLDDSEIFSALKGLHLYHRRE